MRFGSAFLASAIFAMHSPALADVTAHYASIKSDDMTLTVWIADDGRVRVEGRGRTEFLMITRDGVGYAVPGGREGRTVARQDDYFALLRSARTDSTREIDLALVGLVSTAIEERGTETVAGRQGTIYALVSEGFGTRRDSLDLVISSDAELAPVGQEMSRLLGLVGSAFGMESEQVDLLDRLEEVARRGTPLRFGTLQLVSVNRERVPDSAFDLPGPVLDRAELAATMGDDGPLPSLWTPAAPPGPTQGPPVILTIPLPDPARDR